MTEIRNFKSVLVIEYWNLRFNCNLVFGIWDFELFDVLNDFYDFYGFYDLPLTIYHLRFDQSTN
jgi:hypothetical protein